MNSNMIMILVIVLIVVVIFVVNWIMGNLFGKIDDKIHNSRVEKKRKDAKESNSENLADKYK